MSSLLSLWSFDCPHAQNSLPIFVSGILIILNTCCSPKYPLQQPTLHIVIYDLCLLLEFSNPFIQDWKFVENLPIINKTKQRTKGRKKYKMEGPQGLANKESFKKGGLQREWKKIKDPTLPLPPTITRNVLNNERGGTLERMFSPKEPSPIITTCLEIKATCAHYNATNILCL